MPTRVFVVDDEQDITAIVKRGLEHHGFKVTAFNSPIKALAHYSPGAFDIILLDIRMPEMTGFELARSIWDTDRNVHICFMTSFEIYEGEAAKVFPSMGNRCFLRKPITIEQLARHINTQLGLSSPDLTSHN
ncbi:MAG TPA: response regulator [Nitrososphaera sp.]|nr:response regulator [Nitrososphaera sp.]